jgi:hypothetical protein
MGEHEDLLITSHCIVLCCYNIQTYNQSSITFKGQKFNLENVSLTKIINTSYSFSITPCSFPSPPLITIGKYIFI